MEDDEDTLHGLPGEVTLPTRLELGDGFKLFETSESIGDEGMGEFIRHSVE